jgi:hypothetical protein
MLEILTSTATIINPQVNQTVHDTLLSLLQFALLGLSAAVSYGVKLWINSMQSSWKKAIAERLVKYAEQKIAPNDEKLAYVAQKMHDHFPRLSEEEIHHLLEEAVANLGSSDTVTVSTTATTPDGSATAVASSTPKV